MVGVYTNFRQISTGIYRMVGNKQQVHNRNRLERQIGHWPSEEYKRREKKPKRKKQTIASRNAHQTIRTNQSAFLLNKKPFSDHNRRNSMAKINLVKRHAKGINNKNKRRRIESKKESKKAPPSHCSPPPSNSLLPPSNLRLHSLIS